jgi:hypothetical protein
MHPYLPASAFPVLARHLPRTFRSRNQSHQPTTFSVSGWKHHLPQNVQSEKTICKFRVVSHNIFFTCKEHISMSFFVGFPSHFGLTHHSQRMHVHSPLSESTLRTCSLNTQALSSGPCLTQMSMRAPNSALPVHVCVCMQYVCACIGCMECMYVAKYVRMHVYV